MRIFSFLVLAAVFGCAVYTWHMPPEVAALYAVLSVLSFAMYVSDKAAAKAGRWRTSENSLLLVGLACGWPGAMLAQTLLRHKSSKPSFQMRFWCTVIINIALFAWLSSPLSPLRHL